MFLQSREHLDKAQQGLLEDGVSNVILKLKTTTDQGSKYSGDLLASMEILKNTTQIFKGAGYSIRHADVEVTTDRRFLFFKINTRCLYVVHTMYCIWQEFD